MSTTSSITAHFLICYCIFLIEYMAIILLNYDMYDYSKYFYVWEFPKVPKKSTQKLRNKPKTNPSPGPRNGIQLKPTTSVPHSTYCRSSSATMLIGYSDLATIVEHKSCPKSTPNSNVLPDDRSSVGRKSRRRSIVLDRCRVFAHRKGDRAILMQRQVKARQGIGMRRTSDHLAIDRSVEKRDDQITLK